MPASVHRTVMTVFRAKINLKPPIPVQYLKFNPQRH
jgi:hypothetical protein